MSESPLTPGTGQQAPAPATPAAGGSSGGRQEAPRRAGAPDDETLLGLLFQSCGLAALNVLKPAQVATMQAGYKAILAHRQKAQARRAEGAVPDAALGELLRKDPAFANALAPFLTDEQIATFLRCPPADQGG